MRERFESQGNKKSPRLKYFVILNITIPIDMRCGESTPRDHVRLINHSVL